MIKYGGNAMTDGALRRTTASALGALRDSGVRLIVVHGGGPFIAAGLDDAGLESRFVRGLRVTDDAAITVVEQALTMLGKRLAQEIGDAVGVTGRDGALLTAEVADAALGRVGRVTRVHADLLQRLLNAGVTPVLACLAIDADGAPLNVNADEVAGAVAAACRARVAFLTDVPGVLDDADDPGSLLRELTEAEARLRIQDGRIAGGMIPKVEAALDALARGAPSATILDGRTEGAVAKAVDGRTGTRLVPTGTADDRGAS
ncbi:MAG: acetylglutamate kinase [Trueperaceae bacterium]